MGRDSELNPSMLPGPGPEQGAGLERVEAVMGTPQCALPGIRPEDATLAPGAQKEEPVGRIWASVLGCPELPSLEVAYGSQTRWCRGRAGTLGFWPGQRLSQPWCPSPRDRTFQVAPEPWQAFRKL